MVLETVFETRILWLIIQQEGAGPPLSAVKGPDLCGTHFYQYILPGVVNYNHARTQGAYFEYVITISRVFGNTIIL